MAESKNDPPSGAETRRPPLIATDPLDREPRKQDSQDAPVRDDLDSDGWERL
jgi:hypothetical protein